jgi:hypothetical protein
MDPNKQKEFKDGNPEFFKLGEIGRWLDALSKARSSNDAHWRWLMDCLKEFNDRKDFARAKKVSEMLGTYPQDNLLTDDEEIIGHVKEFAGTAVRHGGRKAFGYDD